MTWWKASDQFADEVDQLSDAAFRCHVEASILVMRRERGPVLPKALVVRNMNATGAKFGIAELVDLGLWSDLGDAYQVVHHMEHQPEPDVIAARRANAAARQQRFRRKTAGLDSVTRDTTRDVTHDTTRYPGRVGSGRVGTGKNAVRDDEQHDNWDCGCTRPKLAADADGTVRCLNCQATAP